MAGVINVLAATRNFSNSALAANNRLLLDNVRLAAPTGRRGKRHDGPRASTFNTQVWPASLEVSCVTGPWGQARETTSVGTRERWKYAS